MDTIKTSKIIVRTALKVTIAKNLLSLPRTSMAKARMGILSTICLISGDGSCRRKKIKMRNAPRQKINFTISEAYLLLA